MILSDFVEILSNITRTNSEYFIHYNSWLDNIFSNILLNTLLEDSKSKLKGYIQNVFELHEMIKNYFYTLSETINTFKDQKANEEATVLMIFSNMESFFSSADFKSTFEKYYTTVASNSLNFLLHVKHNSFLTSSLIEFIQPVDKLHLYDMFLSYTYLFPELSIILEELYSNKSFSKLHLKESYNHLLIICKQYSEQSISTIFNSTSYEKFNLRTDKNLQFSLLLRNKFKDVSNTENLEIQDIPSSKDSKAPPLPKTPPNSKVMKPNVNIPTSGTKIDNSQSDNLNQKETIKPNNITPSMLLNRKQNLKAPIADEKPLDPFLAGIKLQNHLLNKYNKEDSPKSSSNSNTWET
jgi:hypothetical protein